VNQFVEIFYTNHAVKQMFQRNISTKDIENVLHNGEVLKDYPDDKPLPSQLLFLKIGSRPLHVVCSFNDETKTAIVITTYEPTLDIWESNFKIRKK
jgi:hypothetical protein